MGAELSAGEPQPEPGRCRAGLGGTMLGMNRLTFRRLAGEYRLDTAFDVDIAMPVVDGRPLHELVGERFYGVDTALVAPPSKHLMGSPAYVSDDRTVILDGGCFEAGCCGVMARVIVDNRTVVWTDFFARGHPDIPTKLKFTFDRQQYESALASVGSLEAEPLPDDA